ncbi:uncharacterized protein LOC132554334 [Ylistrum balloti]|uniref:uncharacterized protein LOC132554334 n=1 Tax=Ylistrum balloti TaxID=509963 RepID=UPI002905A3E7|nr:uncharacterized protein LOC132554334 [Ylistrum balloti]
MIIFASNVVIFSQTNESFTFGRKTDLNTLIHQFLLMCGYDYICHISNFPMLTFPAPDESYNITGVCPTCHCDNECMSRGDCCPDVYFALPPMTCVNTTLLNATYSSKIRKLTPKPPSYEIVSSCPNGTGSRDRNRCEKTYSIKELLIRPPVASTKFPVSYKNKYCAKCNGENNTSNWILDIDCLKFADFNFLSTYQEIIDQARNRKCRMRYTPMQHPVRPCELKIQPKDKKITRSCNVFGSWKAFNQAIKLACESTYQLQFRQYKNVFCYMCNPPTHISDDVIGRCNTTGMWYPYDAGLERACLYHSASQNTRPFKNIFCYLCNRIANDNEMFYDVTTAIKEKMSIIARKRTRFYSYIIKTGKIRTNHLRYIYTVLNMQGLPIDINIDMHVDRPEKSLIVRKNDRHLNVTNLIYKMFAVRPFDQFCDNALVPLQYVLVVFKKCSCQPSSCLFRPGRICCLDASLTYPASCIDTFAVRSNQRQHNTKNVFVTDGCWNDAGHPVIRNRCTSNNPTDASSFLPLVERIQNTHYKSFDCYLCNRNITQINPTNRIEKIAKRKNYFLSDVNIMCESVLDFSHLVSFMDVINLSKHINCDVQFRMNRGTQRFNPNFPLVKCIKHTRLVSRCNVTGNWPVFDPDVAWACEIAPGNTLAGYKRFKNFYCYLCNPEHVVTDVISTCNETGQWQHYNMNYEKACHLFPRIYSYPQYKNIFCEICNSAGIPEILPDPQGHRSDLSPRSRTDPSFSFQLTFRSIFSVAEYDDSQPEVNGERCRKHQIYDYRKDQCRNISCFPGKVLNDSSCIPLLTITNNLRYTLSIEFNGHLQGNNTNALDFLKSVEIGIKQHISKMFGVREFKFDNFLLLSNFPCESNSAYINTENIKLFLYTTLHIEGYVPRFRTENSLLENTSDLWNVTIKRIKVLELAAKTSLTAVMTPSIIQKASFKETCYIQRFSDHSFVPWQTFRSVYVSKVLLCQQIELESDEYDINMIKMELTIHSIGKTLPFDKFQRSSHGRVRVCVEDVEAISDPVFEDVDSALAILTLVCNIASLICLFLTFIVYLVNPTLQSIPGINNMCLVFALFFTQLSFQFGLTVSLDSTFCEVIGIILHVLWLSMFGCVNICSFHMFRVFSGIGSYHALHNKVKTLRKYVMYSFGLPVVIVFVNTVFTLGFNKGQTTGYGVDKCFISSKISFIVTFLLPVILVCLSNIIFFSITAYKIRNTPRVDSNQENHRHFGIYVKLFIITGVSWLATVIEAFFPLSVVSYLTTILNGSQGVLIFLGFIVNKRVYVLLKEGYENASRRLSRTISPPATQTSSVALSSSSESR